MQLYIPLPLAVTTTQVEGQHAVVEQLEPGGEECSIRRLYLQVFVFVFVFVLTW